MKLVEDREKEISYRNPTKPNVQCEEEKNFVITSREKRYWLRIIVMLP